MGASGFGNRSPPPPLVPFLRSPALHYLGAPFSILWLPRACSSGQVWGAPDLLGSLCTLRGRESNAPPRVAAPPSFPRGDPSGHKTTRWALTRHVGSEQNPTLQERPTTRRKCTEDDDVTISITAPAWVTGTDRETQARFCPTHTRQAALEATPTPCWGVWIKGPFTPGFYSNFPSQFA